MFPSLDPPLVLPSTVPGNRKIPSNPSTVCWHRQET